MNEEMIDQPENAEKNSQIDPTLAEKLEAAKKSMADGVLAKDKALQEQIAAL